LHAILRTPPSQDYYGTSTKGLSIVQSRLSSKAWIPLAVLASAEPMFRIYMLVLP